jgi:FkbM family methyltransferase
MDGPGPVAIGVWTWAKSLIRPLTPASLLNHSRRNRGLKSFFGLNQSPIRSIIDVGAHEGEFARKALDTFPEAHFYCFEPLPESFKRLETWASRRMHGRAALFNVALGEREESIEMFLHLEQTDCSSILESTPFEEKRYPSAKTMIQVRQSTLDTMAKSFSPPLRKEILVKLDVQGYESRVINGGRETLLQARACLVEVSLDMLYKGQATFKELLLMLDQLGLRYAGNMTQVNALDGHVVYIDALFIR